MMQKTEVKNDLVRVVMLITFIAIVLTFIKMYDTKTNEVEKIGEKIFSRFID